MKKLIVARFTRAMARMKKGDSPSQIISYMVANDVQNQPQFRQYGVVGLVNGSPEAAAHTGTSTDNYKGHIVGLNYQLSVINYHPPHHKS